MIKNFFVLLCRYDYLYLVHKFLEKNDATHMVICVREEKLLKLTLIIIFDVILWLLNNVSWRRLTLRS